MSWDGLLNQRRVVSVMFHAKAKIAQIEKPRAEEEG